MKKLHNINVRANIKLEETDGKKRLIGLIPFNSRSVDMGFYEVITETAFNKTLADGYDVKAFFNHDTNKLLGRVKNGSLILRKQDDGLYIEAILPNTSVANDAYELIKNEYVSTMSFGFIVIKEKSEIEDGKEVRYLQEVALKEVSFGVSFPAYEATESVARSVRGIDLDKLSQSLEDNDYIGIEQITKQLNGILNREETKKPLPVDDSKDRLISTLDRLIFKMKQ